MLTKQQIMTALHDFAVQRPGLDFANYGDVSAYRSESRKITQQLNDFYALTYYVNTRDSITSDMLLANLNNRLTIVEHEGKMPELEYCTGQYWPTEYRYAVCRVLASTIWGWLRDCCECQSGDDIRKAARREFQRGIAKRWFN